TKPYPMTGRPKAVSLWVSRGRKGTPEIEGGAAGIDQAWWEWWTFLNPDWRVRGGKLAQEGEGEWEVLKAAPSLNGFLNVLMCLKWWRAMMDMPSLSWQRALTDVKWALERMVR
ncbi:hypothetical protein C8R45DRAFT_843702, partial [Mycena sanguinolenta]